MAGLAGGSEREAERRGRAVEIRRRLSMAGWSILQHIGPEALRSRRKKAVLAPYKSDQAAAPDIRHLEPDSRPQFPASALRLE